MDEYMGVVKIFTGMFVPAGYMACDGTLLPINQNQALFSVLGTIYGGDGIQNFALPDLRGRVPIGIYLGGGGPNPPQTALPLAEKGGSSTVTLTADNLPAHTHAATLKVSSGYATNYVPTANNSIATPGTDPSGHGGGGSFTPTLGFNKATPDVALNSNSVVNAVTGNAKPTPINIRPPYLAIRYIICVNGYYPPPQQ